MDVLFELRFCGYCPKAEIVGPIKDEALGMTVYKVKCSVVDRIIYTSPKLLEILEGKKKSQTIPMGCLYGEQKKKRDGKRPRISKVH